MKRHLLIMPVDGIAPIEQAIGEAQSSLMIKMFLFNEPRLLREVVEAHRRGLTVRVMLNPTERPGSQGNEETFRALAEAGIEVKETNPRFLVSHEKSMVVDQRAAFIQSLNWAPRHFISTRDHCIITEDPVEVSEVTSCFDADWNRQEFDCGMKAKLVWCNGNARTRLARFIAKAKHELLVQNDRFSDVVILERLVRARRRGVKVRVLTAPHHAYKGEKLWEPAAGLHLLFSAGIAIRKLEEPSPHTAMMAADGERAIVGSIHLTPQTFDERRDLAIEVSDKEIVNRTEAVFREDWKNSHHYDLTDEGIIKDLLKRGEHLLPEVDIEGTREPAVTQK